MTTIYHEKPWYFSALSAFLAEDVPRVVGLSPAAFARDVTTLERRCASEGESFLTKTLPLLGKAIDFALQGTQPLEVLGFKKITRSSALPAFLSALTGRVFTLSGTLVENPCTIAIRLLRQICYWCKKVQKGFTDESLQKAVDKFIHTDSLLPDVAFLRDTKLTSIARAITEMLFARGPNVGDFRPQHGPGAVASSDGIERKRTTYLERKYTLLEEYFRPTQFFFSLRDVAEDPTRVYNRMACEYGLSKTTFVEKDSSGPRTIGLEQAEYMWCQQSIKNAMYDHIENHPLTKGQVNFTDQTINQRKTSEWFDYDTLDMSEASDRNSFALVKLLFGKTKLWPYLQASRSPGTVLPNGEVLMFKKFAPMGSAVCFPVEAVVFYTLALASLHLQGYPLNLARKHVFVYGDDLIVPHGYFAQMKLDFESVGLKFNESKCCTAGKFRESCGMDAYDGVDVTPVRLRKAYPENKNEVSFIPLVEHANRLTQMGYWAAASSFREAACKTFKTLKELRLPTSPRDDLPFLYWHDIFSHESVRYVYRNGLTTVRGFAYKSCEQKGKNSSELSYYHESLCRGGPVGRLLKAKDGTCRVFDVPYRGKLVRRLFTIAPKFSGVQPDWVTNL